MICLPTRNSRGDRRSLYSAQSMCSMTTVSLQDGYTAIIASAQNGHVEVAMLLLNSGADIHAASKVRRAAQGMRIRPNNLLRLG